MGNNAWNYRTTYNTEYQRARRAERRALGLCTACGEKRHPDSLAHCPRHVRYFRFRARKLRGTAPQWVSKRGRPGMNLRSPS